MKYTTMLKTIGISAFSLFFAIVLSACKPDTNTTESDSVGAEPPWQNAVMTVYKSPTCGCCKDWVTYLEEEGFQVTSVDHDDMNTVKTNLGLTDPGLMSCHTAVIDGYLVEGHVPANDIKKLLTEKPTTIKGLSAPGMPTLSPGMNSRTPKDYDVLSFSEAGEVAVYSSY
ncbi:MAG: DUF411 domain-containing protein [Gammaproteobacteria bacterium]|nr:DUF411 domain-containing protein [Gammaproteobacteria bacterium]